MNHELAMRFLQAGASALAGAAIGWAAQSLTIAGRVDAIEKGQQRLEALMLQVIGQNKARP